MKVLSRLLRGLLGVVVSMAAAFSIWSLASPSEAPETRSFAAMTMAAPAAYDYNLAASSLVDVPQTVEVGIRVGVVVASRSTLWRAVSQARQRPPAPARSPIATEEVANSLNLQSGGAAVNTSVGQFGLGEDALSQAAGAADRGGFSAAGRSLTKHGAGARPGNALFPQAAGNPSEISALAQSQVDDILTAPGTTFVRGFRGRFGSTIEVTAADGRGIVYDTNGNFLFFKE